MKIKHHGPLDQAAGRAVRDYLEALKLPDRRLTNSPPLEVALRRLEEINEELVGASPIRELKLVQERHDMRRLLARTDLDGKQSLENEFIAVAGVFSRRHNISYRTWREMGVPAAVLRRAGIRPGPRTRESDRGTSKPASQADKASQASSTAGPNVAAGDCDDR